MANENYFDDKGNYINAENLSLAEIFNRGKAEGYKKGFVDGSLAELHSKTASETADNLFLKLMGGGAV